MDVIAHALWTTMAATAARRKWNRPIHLGWAAFWGVFPDLVSFTIPAALRIWWWLTGASKSLLPDSHSPRFDWVWGLYNCSHSVLVFAAIFGAVCLLARRPVLEMPGWLLHISIDVFTHRGMFAIHYLWPLSAATFDGIPWETGWFLALNYTTLALVAVRLYCRSSRITEPRA